ncbi:predicted protein [Uncinocarpus reesii 1704]|uniref:Uncharacterized protein n=1 Tax=Uncinocarpus reesii (strain UAMH 1704) TaxID=336963 RepID=C4JPL4_UNCRE|nr:uncharacterized protein UREG_03186 [Uncinocarpus reesii 1704]EEP78340.1 predicted protein [Uncinocarpus reesii 1704]
MPPSDADTAERWRDGEMRREAARRSQSALGSAQSRRQRELIGGAHDLRKRVQLAAARPWDIGQSEAGEQECRVAAAVSPGFGEFGLLAWGCRQRTSEQNRRAEYNHPS